MKQEDFQEIMEKKMKELDEIITEAKNNDLIVSDIGTKFIFHLALYSGFNHYESLGILEEAKHRFIKASDSYHDELEFENEHFPIQIQIESFHKDLKFEVCAHQLDEPSNLDNRTELFQKYLIENDIDPIIGEVKDWFVTNVDINDEGEIWTLSN